MTSAAESERPMLPLEEINKNKCQKITHKKNPSGQESTVPRLGKLKIKKWGQELCFKVEQRPEKD